jgi:hypothetical protein
MQRRPDLVAGDCDDGQQEENQPERTTPPSWLDGFGQDRCRDVQSRLVGFGDEPAGRLRGGRGSNSGLVVAIVLQGVEKLDTTLKARVG